VFRSSIPVSTREEGADPMRRFEYLVIGRDIPNGIANTFGRLHKELNEYGENGWELMAVFPTIEDKWGDGRDRRIYRMFFKRELEAIQY
jgi:hypothetical protein